MSTSDDETNQRVFKKPKLNIEDIDFNIKKPGDHAKAGEWRKWKTMQREIKQARIEKRLQNKEKLEKEIKENDNLKEKNKNCGLKNGRKYTISMAIPSSIIAKVQSKELKTYVCGQIARAATLFSIDEIVVYNDSAVENKNTRYEDDNQLVVKVLEYLECPQYLRKSFFPSQKLLEFVGLLNPLDAPHHFRIHDDWYYREGVTTDIPCKEENGTWVDIGLMHKVLVDKKIKPGIRVTVMKKLTNNGKIKGLIVSPNTPRTEHGYYWGYQVRYASSFKKVLTECPFGNEYDLKIGSNNNSLNFDCLNDVPNYNNAIIIFGCANGLQAAIESDEKFKVNIAEELFDYYITKQADIGSRSVRSEEAILITLSTLKPILDKANESIIKNGHDKIDSIKNDEENK